MGDHEKIYFIVSAILLLPLQILRRLLLPVGAAIGSLKWFYGEAMGNGLNI